MEFFYGNGFGTRNGFESDFLLSRIIDQNQNFDKQYAWMSEPVTKHFFDSQNNPGGVGDDGTWPFHPTSAGRRWIDLGPVSNKCVD